MFVSVALALLVLSAGAKADTAVSVQIAGVSNDGGKLHVSVFDSKKGWLKKPVMQEAVAADGDSATLELQLPPGDYAFHAFHDVDDNGKMKTNFIF